MWARLGLMPIPMRTGSSAILALLVALGVAVLTLAPGNGTAAAQSVSRAATPTPDQVTVAPAAGTSGTAPATGAPTVARTTPPTPPLPAGTVPVTPARLHTAATVAYTTSPPTTPAPTTTTTLASIGEQFTPGPVTLPLRTKGSNGHVDPLFAWLSGIGFAMGLLMIAARLVITRSGGRDRAPLT